VGDRLQWSRDYLWVMGVFLELLADIDTRYCSWIQLGISDLRGHSGILVVLLLVHSEEFVYWSGRKSRRTIVRLAI
jgi:hypothetical protein